MKRMPSCNDKLGLHPNVGVFAVESINHANYIGIDRKSRLTFNDGELEVKCLDYSGNEKDKRVMGVAYFKPKSSSLSPDSTLQWTVPADWTMEDAATVPVLYTLAYYCITQKAELKEGEYVLIHAGMTPIGQAMISVALQAGARIITSVVDEEEALHLMKHFPNLNHSQVFVLEKEDISVAVMKRTGTKGVRAIINCLRGKDFHSTIKTADSHCRCINLAEMNIEDKEIIGLYHFFENRSAIGVSLNSIKMCSDECKKFLRQALMQGISQGIVRPLKKRTVCLREFPNFLRKNQRNNKVEKIVVVSKYRDDTLTQNGNFQFELNRVHIITGKNVDLKFQLAEWLIDHGAKKIIMVNDDETNEIHYLQKINRIVHRKNCVITTSPSSCLDSVESTLQFLKEVSRFGSVSSIFCVRMDEKDSHMKNLDSASRQLLPGLQKFVSLLGKGSVVCDSRARNGLPACSIQTKRPLESPAKILPYLFSLLTDSQKAKFYLVSGTVSATKVKDEVDLLSYLPSSVEELIALGESIEACPKFVEQTTLSLRYSLVKHNFLPVFVVPGLGRHSVESLLRRLMYPAFCCSLPEDVPSIDELAATLAKDISEIQPSGPYNIVGDSWGGALALTIGRLLDARGEQVTLTLIQGVPTTAQNRLRALSERFGSDLRTCIVNAALNTQEEIISQSNWKEMLAELLPKLEPDVREPVSRAVNALNNQFNSLLRFKPSSQLFKGEVTLIRNKSGLLQDIENISKFCQNAPKVVTIDETNHHHLLSSRTLSTAILENMAFI